jgi:hypothetical protein
MQGIALRPSLFAHNQTKNWSDEKDNSEGSTEELRNEVKGYYREVQIEGITNRNTTIKDIAR